MLKDFIEEKPEMKGQLILVNEFDMATLEAVKIAAETELDEIMRI